MEHNIIYTTPYDSEVEYLESTGTQWIDTGIKTGSDYSYELVVKVRQDTGTYGIFVR